MNCLEFVLTRYLKGLSRKVYMAYAAWSILDAVLKDPALLRHKYVVFVVDFAKLVVNALSKQTLLGKPYRY